MIYTILLFRLGANIWSGLDSWRSQLQTWWCLPWARARCLIYAPWSWKLLWGLQPLQVTSNILQIKLKHAPQGAHTDKKNLSAGFSIQYGIVFKI